MRRFLAFIYVVWLICGHAAASDGASPARITDSILQIGIAHQAPRVTLRPEGDFAVIDQATGEIKRLERGVHYKVEADKGQRLLLGPFLFLGPTRLLPGGPADYVLIEGKKYRGNLVFKPNGNATVTVVDEVGIEEYLYGVLPKEMSPDWPLEALKAQAVVARTFALSNLGKFASSGYDLSDDARSQVYSGLEVESPQIRRAVDETAGLVLHYQGALLPAFFHSCCGGATADPALIWSSTGRTLKPLRGVSDRYCKGSPFYQWSAYFPAADILRQLQRHGQNALKLRSIAPGSRAASGHVRELRFHLDTGRVSLKANDFRKWMGVSDIRSTQIWRVARRRNGYEFAGRGFGHGVGLCQWGARAQGMQGRAYRKILRHYFPGAELVTHEE